MPTRIGWALVAVAVVAILLIDPFIGVVLGGVAAVTFGLNRFGPGDHANRSQAIWRVFGFFYLLTVAAIITGVVTVVAFVWGLVDVLWQYIGGADGLSERSRPAKIIKATLQWDVDMLVFVTTGGGPGRLVWLPDW